MSPRDLTYDALDYINVATIALASARQLQRIARDLTATLQQIYSLAPALYKRRDSAILAAPLTVSVTVVNGSTALTCATALVDGSSILIGGDPSMYNEVRIQGSSKFLRYPFNGLSGTYDGTTVYGDSVLLDSSVDRVIGTVRLNETYELTKRVNRQDIGLLISPDSTDYGRRVTVLPMKHVVAQPLAYWVEPVYFTDGNVANNRSYLRMRLFPMPFQAFTLGYDVRVRAPRFASGDLGTDSVDSTATIPVAADMVEACVRPLFLNRWAGSPWFRDKEARAAIAEDAKAATVLLAQYRPQQPSNRRITPRF